jgi:NifU-like protein
MIAPFSWDQFPKKLKEKIERPKFVGKFEAIDATSRGMRLAFGKEKGLILYWLVDESDGIIADAKFQVFGPPLLIAAGEIASEMVLRKTYDQATRISSDLLDQHIRDTPGRPAFPEEGFPFLNRALSAIDKAALMCSDIPFVSSFEMTPIEEEFGEIPGGIPGWDGLSIDERKKAIETVLEREIRPYVELDAGGVKLSKLSLVGEVGIVYEGSCTSCHASTGSTLTAIQRILRARVHPSLFVVPEIPIS